MKLFPDHIKNLAPYKPGKPISEVMRELGLTKVIKLASNENPFGMSKKVIDSIKDKISDFNRYPDLLGFDLRSKIARRYDLEIENVILGSGSEGIILTILRSLLFADDEIITAQNSFIGFKVMANASGNLTHYIPMRNYKYDLQAIMSKINDKTKLIYIANPDNPTGTYINKVEFEEFIQNVPTNVIVIMDEAYHEFGNCFEDYPHSMQYRKNNIIALRTFSKVYGLAGFRLGYGFGPKNIINQLLKVKLPFEPSLPAQIAGIAALDDDDFVKNTVENNKSELEKLIIVLENLKIKYIPSATNFISLVFNSEHEAKNLTGNLLNKGIILRHLKSFGWPNCVRVSIGTPVEMELFTKELKTYYNS